MSDQKKQPKDKKTTNEKPIAIPVDFEDTLRDLLVTPLPEEPKEAEKPKTKKKARPE